MTACRFDGPDIVQLAAQAVGIVDAGVAGGALIKKEDLLSEFSVGGKGPVGIAVRTGTVSDERSEITREGVKVGAAARVGSTQGRVRRTGWNKSGSQGEVPDLALEILHFVEVGRPVKGSVGGSGGSVGWGDWFMGA